jgi:hypothetical protein
MVKHGYLRLKKMEVDFHHSKHFLHFSATFDNESCNGEVRLNVLSLSLSFAEDSLCFRRQVGIRSAVQRGNLHKFHLISHLLPRQFVTKTDAMRTVLSTSLLTEFAF